MVKAGMVKAKIPRARKQRSLVPLIRFSAHVGGCANWRRRGKHKKRPRSKNRSRKNIAARFTLDWTSQRAKSYPGHVEELLNRGVLRQLGDIRCAPPRLVARVVCGLESD